RRNRFLAQEFYCFLELSVLRLRFWRDHFRLSAGLGRGLIGLGSRLLFSARHILEIAGFQIIRPLYFNRRSDARTRAVFAEKRLAAGRSPFHGRQQQAIAIAQGEELLLSAGAETLLADNIAAFVLEECRGDNLRRPGCAVIDQDICRAVE